MGLFDRFRTKAGAGDAPQRAAAAGKLPARCVGLYVHIPFCVRKCLYCDFPSFEGSAEQRERYLKALHKEIALRGNLLGRGLAVDTVFFGGGTPTVCSAEELAGLLDEIRRRFVVLPDAEITTEANPGTVDDAKFAALKEAGFTRVSLGVQSFDDGVLLALGRIHTAEDARRAAKSAKSAGVSVNLDLMLGVPAQTRQIWEKSLDEAIALQPDHLSYYSLQLEESTPFYDAYRLGDLTLPSWEENRAMYHAALTKLRGAGYEPYEISNAALPGRRCRHNLKYWTMGEYLGLGLSAHSFLAGKRFANTDDLEIYCDSPGAAFAPQKPDPTGLRGDWLFTRLRLLEGFPKADYAKTFGEDWDGRFGEAARELIEAGWLEEADGNVRLTEQGLDHTNPVMEKLLAAIKGGSDE